MVLTGDKDETLNASVALATEIGDTIKRIDGTEVPLRAPWKNHHIENAKFYL